MAASARASARASETQPLLQLTEADVQKSFAALKSYFTPATRSETGGNIAQLVLFAEHVLKDGYKEIAGECVDLYMSLKPPVNQFFVRALLCQAEVAAPASVAEEHQLVEALGSLVKAVSIAKKSECYHFLVFNASVLMWSIVRPFQQVGYQRVYIGQLQTVVKALAEIHEKDYTWRLELMRGLFLAQTDDGQREEAVKTGSSVINLARKHVPDQVIPTFKLMVLNGVADTKVVDKEMKAYPELGVLVKLWKLKSLTLPKQPSRSSSGAATAVTVAGGGGGGSAGPNSADIEQRLAKLLTLILKGEEADGRRTNIHKMQPLPPDIAAAVVLELGQLAMEQGYIKVAVNCLAAVSEQCLHTADQLVQYRLLSAYVSVTSIDVTAYTKSAIEVCLKGVKQCEECLSISMSNDSKEMVEHCCVVLWNLTLPLLQPGLHHHLHRSLTAVAKALETIDSLQSQLRVLVHLELSRICADQDKLSPALEHLQKASSLDCHGVYHLQARQLQHQLTLRAQLYTTPTRSVDRAAQIIEQLKNTTGKEIKGEGLRSLLMKAGQFLVPEYFDSTILHGDDNKPVSTDPVFRLKDLAKKAQSYTKCKQAVVKHSDCIGRDEEEERVMVWTGLVKAARKGGAWDVAQFGAMMCLLYDDNRWQYSPELKPSTHRIADHRMGKRGSTPGRTLSRAKCSIGLEKTLLRTLAEVHCLHAECLVRCLQQENLQLGSTPRPTSAGLDIDACVGEQWITYCDWATTLTDDAHKSFLRAAEIGSQLQDPWLVSNAVVYLWNHHLTTLQQGKMTSLVDVFRMLMKCVMKVALKNEHTLVCQLATALASGLVERWMSKSTSAPASVSDKKRGSRAASPKFKGKKGESSVIQLPSEALPDLKEAVEACEYSMAQFVGVPLPTRQRLLGAWVQTKQLLQQSITTTSLPSENEADPHVAHCRAIVAVEMYRKMMSIQQVFEFPNCSPLQEVCAMVTKCEWEREVLLEAELYTHLANAALNNKEYQLVYSCCEHILLLADKLESIKGGQLKDRVKGYALLSQAMCVQGQGYAAECPGNTASLKKALFSFAASTKYGCKALSYSYAIQSCRHAWNTCQPLLLSHLDREAVQQPLLDILEYLMTLIGRGGKAEDAPEMLLEADIELMAGVYRVVFQVYADKRCWEDGLAGLEHALWVSPKPLHRGLAEQKIVFKSKMGRNVEGDMIRFQDEPEEVRASLWYSAASSATNSSEQKRAYLRAIEILQSHEHAWKKMEYVIEFALWLHSSGHHIDEVLDHLEWAIELVLSTCCTDDDEPTPSGLDLDTLTLVPQIEMLLRLNVMIAELLGGRLDKHRSFCLCGLGSCILLWKRVFSSTGDQKGKSQQLQMPTTVDQWVAFTLPAELKTILSTASDDSSLVCPTTINKPLLTLHYLEQLVEGLCAHELHPLTFPVLHLQLLIAECIVDSEALTQLVHLRLARLCQELSLQAGSAGHVTAAGNRFPLPSDLARSHCELELLRSKQAALNATVSASSSSSSSSRKRKNGGRQGHSSVHDTMISSELCLRKVWSEQAKILTDQGMYQAAFNLLQHSMTASEVYNDSTTLLECLIQLAHLTLLENRPDKAITFLLKAQELLCSSQQCVEMVTLFSEAQNMLPEGERDEKLLSAIVKSALKTLDEALQQLPNEAPAIKHAIAFTKARCATNSNDLELELSTCIKTLTDVGCHCDAAHCLMRLADYHSNQCTHTGCETHKHHLLKAVETSRHAVRILQEKYEQVVKICQPSKSMVLPVQRELVKAQVQLADLLAVLTSQAEEEEQAERDKWQMMSSVDKYIDEFVQGDAMVLPVLNQWKQTARVAKEEAVSVLTAGFNLSKHSPELRAQCLYSIGHILHITASQHPLEKGLQWDGHTIQQLRDQEMAREQEKEQVVDKEGEDKGNRRQSILQAVRSSMSNVTMQDEDTGEDDMQRLSQLGQALGALGQSVSIGLHTRQLTVVHKSSLNIANIIGCFDPSTAAAYLALFQSCVASQHLYLLLTRTMSDPQSCELAALLHQEHHLSTNKLAMAYTACETTLGKKYEAWRRLRVETDHLELLKQFNTDFRFVVLQHSLDRTMLYCAYLVPPQPSQTAKKGQQQTGPVQPVVSSASVCRDDLNSLLKLCSQYKKECAIAQHKRNQEMTSELQVQYEAVVADMNMYLSAVTTPVTDALKKEDISKQLTVVILADSDLLSLPLESMEMLQAENVRSVARDFSLQMSYHRLCRLRVGEEEEDTGKKKATGDKYIAQPQSLQINNNSVKYVEDPRNELALPESLGLRAVLQSYPKVTGKWNGHSGSDHIMSEGEWAPLLQRCSGLLLQCSERFLAHYPPQRLAAINMTDCALALILDRMTTPCSYQLQSKLDFNKTGTQLCLEESLSTSMLLSLTGVGCVLTKQWYSSLDDTCTTMKATLEGLLSAATTVGEVYWGLMKMAAEQPPTQQPPTQQPPALDTQPPPLDAQQSPLDEQSNDPPTDEPSLPPPPSAQSGPRVRAMHNFVLYGLPHLTITPPA